MNLMTKQNIAKTVFMSAMILVALIISGYFIIQIGGKVAVSNVTAINGNFGSEYGIHDITKTSNGGLPGLPSTTVSFQVPADENGDGNVEAGLDYVGDFLSQNDTETVTNLKVTPDTSGGVGSKSGNFTYNYYAASSADYQDHTYTDTASQFAGLLNSDFAALNYTSEPTTAGHRIVNVDATVETTDNSNGLTGYYGNSQMQADWNDLIFGLNITDPGTTYHVTMTQTVNGVQQTVDGSFANDAQQKQLTTLNDQVWTTLMTYSTNYSFMGLKSATYTYAQDASNDTRFDLVLKANQPTSAGAIDGLAGKFDTQATKDSDAMYTANNETTLRYANTQTPVLVKYPSTRAQY